MGLHIDESTSIVSYFLQATLQTGNLLSLFPNTDFNFNFMRSINSDCIYRKGFRKEQITFSTGKTYRVYTRIQIDVIRDLLSCINSEKAICKRTKSCVRLSSMNSSIGNDPVLPVQSEISCKSLDYNAMCKVPQIFEQTSVVGSVQIFGDASQISGSLSTLTVYDLHRNLLNCN